MTDPVRGKAAAHENRNANCSYKKTHAIGHVFFCGCQRDEERECSESKTGTKDCARRHVSKSIRCCAALFAVPRGDRRTKR